MYHRTERENKDCLCFPAAIFLKRPVRTETTGGSTHQKSAEEAVQTRFLMLHSTAGNRRRRMYRACNAASWHNGQRKDQAQTIKEHTMKRPLSRFTLAAVAACCLLPAGCSLAPDTTPPSLAMPETWTAHSGPDSPAGEALSIQ